MTLIKRTSAWDELCDLLDRDEETGTESTLAGLYDAILDANKTDALDDVVSDEFPNGVDINELEDFFKDERDSILDRLGIESKSDEYDDDPDEEYDEED